jgi:Uma2 family endonuclease
MQQLAKKFYKVEEYLAMEEVAEEKSEFYQGEIFTMAGGTRNHNRIVRNLSVGFTNAFQQGNCEAFVSEVRLWIGVVQLFTYPDIAVVCGDAVTYQDRDDTITNPLIIVEVLSESTKNYDRGEKFKFYRAIPTLREYILVDQYGFHIEQYSMNGEGKWYLTEYKQESDILRFSSIEFEISLQKIYSRVEFE